MSDITPLMSEGINVTNPKEMLKATVKEVEELPEKAIESTVKFLENNKEKKRIFKKTVKAAAEVMGKYSRDLAVGGIIAGGNDYYCTTCKKKTLVIEIDDVNPNKIKK